MNLDEYQQLAKRTAKHPDPNADMYELMALGLIGETGEVVDLIKKHKYHSVPMDVEKLKKEVGDCLWYLANGLTLTDDRLYMPHWMAEESLVFLAESAAHVASSWAHCRMTSIDSTRDYIRELSWLSETFGFTLEDAAAANIEKLQRRYPDGFDLDKARNHDSE